LSGDRARQRPHEELREDDPEAGPDGHPHVDLGRPLRDGQKGDVQGRDGAEQETAKALRRQGEARNLYRRREGLSAR
jgi:hypothetical protein